MKQEFVEIVGGREDGGRGNKARTDWEKEGVTENR